MTFNFRRLKKPALIASCILMLVLFFIIIVLPVIMKNKAIGAIEQATGRTARIGKMGINPFTLSAAIHDVALENKGGGPFIAVGAIRASLSPASIYKRALIVSRISIESPSLVFARTAANTYSFTDILEHHKSVPKKNKPTKDTFHFSINNIAIKKGSLDFDDRAVDGGRKHTIRNLDIAIPFISNIPYLIETFTAPHISAVVNNAPFNFDGNLKPLSKSLESSVRIKLDKLDLPGYAAYYPAKLPLELASGTLTMDTEVKYRVSADKKPELTIKGLVRLDNIAVNHQKLPLMKLPGLEVNASKIEVFTKVFEFEKVAFDKAELFISRDSGGRWMYTKLLSPPETAQKTTASEPGGKTAPDKKSSSPAPVMSIASLELTGATIHFNDAFPKDAFKITVSEIDLAIHNFSTQPNTTADYELSLLLDNDTSFNVDGTFGLTPLAATASLELSELKLQRGWPYLSPFLTAPVKGILGLTGDITFDKEKGVVAQNGSLTLKDLSSRYGDNEGLSLAQLEVKDSSFRQRENSIEVGEIRVVKGNVSLSREADGKLSVLSLLKQKEKKPAMPGEVITPLPAHAPPEAFVKPAHVQAQVKELQSSIHKHADALENTPPVQIDSVKKADTVKKPGDKPLTWRLKRLRLDGFDAAFTDKSRDEKPAFTLRKTSLSLSNLTGPTFGKSPFKFATIFNAQTPITVSGEITPHPFSFKGDVSVAPLPIRDFEAYFPDNINVFLVGGTVDTSMKLDVALHDGTPRGTFKGSVGVRSFHVLDGDEEEDLLKWESLQLEDIQGNLEPRTLSIRQIALNSVYSRIIIRKDGTLNLQNLVMKNDSPAQEQQNLSDSASPKKEPTESAQKPAPPATTQASGQKQQISIGAITIQDGTMSFTDNHLPQQFASTFFNLGGRVSGLSSEETRFAEVDLRGNLENHSPLQITGRINPLRDDLFVDLKLSFKDIELSPTTPYSGTYLGYTVDKGKLFLDLKYLIDKKQLHSENRIFIDQFTFGKKVESAKATSLPVRLAVALLKDRKGEIHLDLPVTGRTDDPQFSIWGVVWQVLKNLLVKAATSPFALISSMFGGGQDLSAVTFASGLTVLTAPEESKLAALAKALADRPGLKVEIKGYVDREKDAEGYRNELFARKLRAEKFLALAKERQTREGDSAESMKVLAEEYPKYLKTVYKKEKFPKPRNTLGFVKDLPDPEMKKLVIANITVGERELLALARERTATVLDYLVQKGSVPAERIFQKIDDIHKAPEKENSVKSRVEMNAIVQ